MIQEAYCSDDVCKLLKEKGINEPCTALNRLVIQDGEKPFMKITHQKAMAWLREEYKIDIAIYPYGNYSSENYQFDVYKNKHFMVSKDDGYMTYEEAVEAALKFCLENLI